MAADGSPRATPLANLALLLVSLGLSLALAEAGLRLAGYDYTPMEIETWRAARQGLDDNPVDRRMQTAFETEHFTHDPTLLWRPRAGLSVFNSRGYRARELPARKPPGEVRIVAVGDSNTLGWKGPEGASWPLTLEDVLRRAGDRFAVINAGVWGYSVFQGRRRFEESLELEPDLALISFGANDAHRVSVSDRDFHRTALSTPLPFLSRSKVGLLLVSFFDARAAAEPAPREARVPRVGLDEYRRALREIVATGAARGVDCVLMTRPYRGRTADPSRWKYHAPEYRAATAEVAAETGAPLIDLHAEFAGKPELFIDESHFDARGHRLAAELVARAILPLLERRGALSAAELERALRPAPGPRVALDLGRRPSMPHLLRGFGRSQQWDGRTSVWSTLPASELELPPLAPRDGRYRLGIEGHAFGPTVPLEVAVAVNDQPAGALRFAGGWQRRQLELPPGLLAAGANRLTFAYSSTARPIDTLPGSADRQQLALAFDRLWLEPAPEATAE